ncbi:isochorismatase family protein [Methylogaea oryzae]|uniref:Bifunctional pyrazinamidase/nicotinamidase n=2 Tax=Methylogaea oryzae TaxID=1295382 RepID=A0A8D4VNC5_9GAMM|nr:isochorismatase family protein [Methylogaea oryzae]BBL71075.1 bifunctional pyrazinamidase/nicotinamidase [Methylogaea oryzae]
MDNIALRQGDALLVTDVQNDFLPGGALAVPRSAHIVAAVNACIDVFRAAALPMVFSRDWHPPDHCSFREQGGPWPAHCVQDSHGAAFAAELRRPEDCRVVSKATETGRDAYSAFDGTGLEALLNALGARRLFVVGLATDYCVKYTVIDALRLGFGAVVLEDAVAAVNVQPDDGPAAMRAMAQAGAVIARRENLCL